MRLSQEPLNRHIPLHAPLPESDLFGIAPSFSPNSIQIEHETHSWSRCSKGFMNTGWYGDDSEHGCRIFFFWSTSLIS